MNIYLTISYGTIIALFLVVFLTVSLPCMYHTKRKYDSFNEYYRNHSKKEDTYKESKKKLKKELNDIGLENKKYKKLLKKTIQLYVEKRGSCT